MSYESREEWLRQVEEVLDSVDHSIRRLKDKVYYLGRDLDYDKLIGLHHRLLEIADELIRAAKKMKQQDPKECYICSYIHHLAFKLHLIAGEFESEFYPIAIPDLLSEDYIYHALSHIGFMPGVEYTDIIDDKIVRTFFDILLPELERADEIFQAYISLFTDPDRGLEAYYQLIDDLLTAYEVRSYLEAPDDIIELAIELKRVAKLGRDLIVQAADAVNEAFLKAYEYLREVLTDMLKHPERYIQ